MGELNVEGSGFDAGARSRFGLYQGWVWVWVDDMEPNVNPHSTTDVLVSKFN